MTAVVGFPLGTIYQITSISQSVPGRVTLSAVTQANSFSVAVGQVVTISKVVGMFQVNDNRYIVTNLDPIGMTFDLYSIQFVPMDTSLFSPYVSGGEINIISYPATAGNPPGLMYNNQ